MGRIVRCCSFFAWPNRRPQFGLRVVLLVTALVAVILGAWRWYYDSYYPVCWEPLTQDALDRALETGRPVVVVIEYPALTWRGTRISDAIDTPKVRRLLHRHHAVALKLDVYLTPPHMYHSVLKSVHLNPAVQPPIALVYGRLGRGRPVLVTDFSSDEPMAKALRQCIWDAPVSCTRCYESTVWGTGKGLNPGVRLCGSGLRGGKRGHR